MDTLGPVSVLDSGRRQRDAVVADRLTRRRTERPPRLKAAHSDLDVVYRIPQPYRTSFSAKHSVERLYYPSSGSTGPGSAADRSRSLSPASSLRSLQSSRSERVGIRRHHHRHQRAKSPKRVTYDTRVTVRHSDADDSMFTELSSRDCESSSSPSAVSHSGRSPASASASSSLQHARPTPPASNNHLSKDSGLDYSTQLKDLSDEIIKMDWSTHNKEHAGDCGGGGNASGTPHGILKESQNSLKQSSHHPQHQHHHQHHQQASSTPSPPHGRAPVVVVVDKENAPNGTPPPPGEGGALSGGVGGGAKFPGDVVSRDYQHDRTFSYSQAQVDDQFSSEVRALVDSGLEGGTSPPFPLSSSTNTARGENGGSLLAQQRSSSVSVVSRTGSGLGHPHHPPATSNLLTPAKRSVSTSIGNFFKRISPHLGRKRGKDRSNNGSRAGSSQSLPATAGIALEVEEDTPSPISTTTTTTTTSSTTTQPSSSSSNSASTPKSSSRHFSRSRIRSSFLKLMGGSRKDSKSKVTAVVNSEEAGASASSPAADLNTSQESEASSSSGGGGSCKRNNAADSERRPMPESTQRRLKSMEKNNLGKVDVYREFKDKRSPRSPGSATSTADADDKLEERYRAIKAQYKDRPHPLDDEFSFDSYTSAPTYSVRPQSRPSWDSGSLRGEGGVVVVGGMVGGSKAEPPSSLDVVVPPSRGIRLLQASTISTISGDESIGECSLDCNLTASQPSLLSGTSQSAASSTLSKKALLNQPLTTDTTTIPHLPPDSSTDPVPPPRRPPRQKDTLLLGQPSATPPPGDKENASPTLSQLSPSTDPSRKPSYLKLSCAVSGYGKYSRYSSYKSIPTRSPFSSTSSLRSDLSSPDPVMPSSVRSPQEGGGGGGCKEDQGGGCGSSLGCSPTTGGAVEGEGGDSGMALAAAAAELSNGGQPLLVPPPLALNGHSLAQPQPPGVYPTGDSVKDGEYFLVIMASEEERLNEQSKRAEGLMRSQDLPEEVNGRIRAAIGKSNLLISQKFQQFKELCSQHMHPEPEDRVPLYADLQGFWDMVKIQVDSVDDNFAEIDHMSQNGWKEIPKLVPSRRSSASSSPKSGSLSQTSTPSATPGHTPGSRRRGLKTNNKDTPDSSPEHAEKMRSAAKARDEARKRMLAEKRAAMKQQQQQQQQQASNDVEIYLPEGSTKK